MYGLPSHTRKASTQPMHSSAAVAPTGSRAGRPRRTAARNSQLSTNSSPTLTSAATPAPPGGSCAAVTGAAGVAGSRPAAPRKIANRPASTNGAANDSTQPTPRPTAAVRRLARASTSSVQAASDTSRSPTSSRTAQPSRIWLPTERSRVGAVARDGPWSSAVVVATIDCPKAPSAGIVGARAAGRTRLAADGGGRKHRGDAARQQRPLGSGRQRQRDAARTDRRARRRRHAPPSPWASAASTVTRSAAGATRAGGRPRKHRDGRRPRPAAARRSRSRPRSPPGGCRPPPAGRSRRRTSRPASAGAACAGCGTRRRPRAASPSPRARMSGRGRRGPRSGRCPGRCRSGSRSLCRSCACRRSSGRSRARSARSGNWRARSRTAAGRWRSRGPARRRPREPGAGSPPAEAIAVITS